MAINKKLEKVELKVVDFQETRMIGKKITVKQGRNAKKHWNTFLNDGSNELLQKLDDRTSPFGDCIGYMENYDPISKTFIEMPGVFTKPNTIVPEGFDYIDLPKCLMGICAISGDNQNIDRGAHNKTVKMMIKEGYEPDYSYGFSFEYYSLEKFVQTKQGDDYTFYYYLPCKKVVK